MHCKTRPVRYHLRAKIENKLQQLVNEGTVGPNIHRMDCTDGTDCETRQKHENMWRLQGECK